MRGKCFGNVNLQRIFLMFGIFVSVAAAAAAVARILPVSVGGLVIIIFGRGFRWCNTLSSLLLFDQLKEAKEKI
jgi:hypothetical protein